MDFRITANIGAALREALLRPVPGTVSCEAATAFDVAMRKREIEIEALIRLLRDETISAAVHARCVAIVGERER